jgi:FMN phosphatase YigB (HAD superfamily)
VTPDVVLPEGVRAVVLDVGETLVDESRAWSEQARAAGVTPFTLMAALGALVDRGEDHRGVWDLLGVERPATPHRIRAEDLYPDALDCLRAAVDAGLVVGVAGNQPAGAEEALREAGVAVDVLGASASWGVAKPAHAYFERVVAATGVPAHCVLHVGDRPDNDIVPAHAAGLRTALLRRGPWGHLRATAPGAELADLRLDSLAQLARAIRSGSAGGR